MLVHTATKNEELISQLSTSTMPIIRKAGQIHSDKTDVSKWRKYQHFRLTSKASDYLWGVYITCTPKASQLQVSWASHIHTSQSQQVCQNNTQQIDYTGSQPWSPWGKQSEAFDYWMITAYSGDFYCLLTFSMNLLQGQLANTQSVCETRHCWIDLAPLRSFLFQDRHASRELLSFFCSNLFVGPQFETLCLLRHSKNYKLSPWTGCFDPELQNFFFYPMSQCVYAWN